MTLMNLSTDASTRHPPLRLWPGGLIVALQWGMRFGVPHFVPDTTPIGVMAGLGGGVAILIWWGFFSRARWEERLGAVVAMAVVSYGTFRSVHPSIATGMMGFMFFVYVVPCLSLALVAAVLVGRKLSDGRRRALMAAAIILSCAGWTLVRTGGFTSDLKHDWAWRWAPTPEDRLLVQAGSKVGTVQPDRNRTAATNDKANWPGFRGAGRDSVIRGVKIETNWSVSPPVELWRQPVGPGWSSFAVAGAHIYTQEQRGDDEVVACYSLTDGALVWRHQDAVRFWESNAGPGPRGTPTLHDGRVYTFGATGILNALDAATGSVRWTRDVAAETKTRRPEWGFASSPLIVGDLVIVAISGTLAAYELASGRPRWAGPAEGGSYSSPHLISIDGIPQIFLMSGSGATSLAPADGKVIWQYGWKGFAIVQPAEIAAGDFLVSTGDTAGVRRIQVSRANGVWSVNERWASSRLKPYFNDHVLHRGCVFGFGSGTLACIDLQDGERKWKGGRYGAGQLLLLADQDLLLVLSEQGELALVAAKPGEFSELARFPALEGKTWNHPVLVGDILLVRNDREMVAFRLAAKRD